MFCFLWEVEKMTVGPHAECVEKKIFWQKKEFFSEIKKYLREMEASQSREYVKIHGIKIIIFLEKN